MREVRRTSKQSCRLCGQHGKRNGKRVAVFCSSGNHRTKSASGYDRSTLCLIAYFKLADVRMCGPKSQLNGFVSHLAATAKRILSCNMYTLQGLYSDFGEGGRQRFALPHFGAASTET